MKNEKADSDEKRLRAVKAAIGRFDPDFDSPADFVKTVVHAVYPKRRPPRAAKLLREMPGE